MKDYLRRLVVGTSIEPLARTIYRAFVRKSVPEYAAPDEKNRQYDAQTLAVMERVLSPASNCIDVGCHQGSFLEEILRIAPRGRHFAFEPIPALCTALRDTFGRLPNVHIYPYALSDTAGESVFQHVVTSPAYSGLRRRRYDRPDEQVVEITVETARLDDVIPRDVPIRFIKVDVEGAELQVFRGATETLSKSRPVIAFEHGIGAADYYATTPDDVYAVLTNQCGLQIYVLGDWLGGRTALTNESFRDHFRSGRHFYFLAAPT